jgi:hypothetical protein
MASTISAGTTTTTALVQSADTSGNLQFQTQAGANTITVPNATGTIMVSGNQPAFFANSNATQSIGQGSWSKVTYGNKVYDTNSDFASSRFTPTVAGYYQINATINFGGGTYPIDSRSAIYKNGSVFAQGSAFITSGTGNGGIQTVSCLVLMNGSTDYLEVYAYTGSSGTTLYGDANNTLFNGCLIRTS